MNKCTVEDCQSRSYCKGFCTKHYQRSRKYGTTDDPRSTCKRGHEMNEDNVLTETDKDGFSHRRCKVCTNDRRRNKTMPDYIYRARQLVFEHFGNGICASCGSPDDLTLDHINNDGGKHRQMLKDRGMSGTCSGFPFYRYLIRNDFDSDGFELQVLCKSCHQAKHLIN